MATSNQDQQRRRQVPGANSKQLYDEAQRVIIGGVNSPSRGYQAVGGGSPVFMERANGAYFWDVDGQRYLDYLGAFGPIILGHAHAGINQALQQAMTDGLLYGAPTRWEVEMAVELQRAIPSMERLRFVNSGTEAVMTAIRVARAYTGRTRIIKCAGCYHGHSDLVLVAAGSGPSTLGIPDSAGVTAATAQEIITVPFNDLTAMTDALARWGDETAAVMLEPIVGNFGMVMPHEGYLAAVHKAAKAAGVLVIYDEVITGFRFHYGGAQNSPLLNEVDRVQPDLTVLGKIIGGGLPIGAYGGRQAIMETVAPLGPTYQAGTMAGNPASMRAGLACLAALREPGLYERLAGYAEQLVEGIEAAAERHGIALVVNRIGGAFSVHFAVERVTNYEEACAANGERFAAWFRELMSSGVCIAPSKYEAWFITAAHSQTDLTVTLEAIDQSLQAISQHPSY